MQADNLKIASDMPHVLLLMAAFAFGIAALVMYFRVIEKLRSVGEPTPRFFERKNIFKAFRRYKEVAEQFSWPRWLPHGYWLALLLALIAGAVYVYWR